MSKYQHVQDVLFSYIFVKTSTIVCLREFQDFQHHSVSKMLEKENGFADSSFDQESGLWGRLCS